MKILKVQKVLSKNLNHTPIYACKQYTEMDHTASFIVKINEITFPKQDLLGSTSLGKVSRLQPAEKIGLTRTGIRKKQTSPVSV